MDACTCTHPVGFACGLVSSDTDLFPFSPFMVLVAVVVVDDDAAAAANVVVVPSPLLLWFFLLLFTSDSSSSSNVYTRFHNSSSMCIQAGLFLTHTKNLADWVGVRMARTDPNSLSRSSPISDSRWRNSASNPNACRNMSSSSLATHRLSLSAAACCSVTPSCSTK